MLNSKNPIDGNFGPTWEEPYVVIKVYDKGAYGLKIMTGPERKITSSQNTMHLKKYYVQRPSVQKKNVDYKMYQAPQQ